jgi:hypothetical protein
MTTDPLEPGQGSLQQGRHGYENSVTTKGAHMLGLCNGYSGHERQAKFDDYPSSLVAFLTHLRRGGDARDVHQPDVERESAAFRQPLKRGVAPAPLQALRPYAAEPGTEWFARLSVDTARLCDPKSRARRHV